MEVMESVNGKHATLARKMVMTMLSESA